MGRLSPATFVLSIVGILVCGAIGVKLYYGGKGALDIFSAVGSVASLFGLAIAIIQIDSVKKTTEATKFAVEETRKQLLINISIADVARAIKLIEQIQVQIGGKKYELAHLRMQDLRASLLQFRGHERFKESTVDADFNAILKNVSIHIINLFNAIYTKEKDINIAVINQTLEDTAKVLVTFEDHLKFNRGNNVPKTRTNH